MSSLPPQPVTCSSPVISTVQDGSPVKSAAFQSSSYDDPADSCLPGPSKAHHAADAVASSSKGKERQKRLSQVVPKRPDSRKLPNEEEPWEPKNVLSFGRTAWVDTLWLMLTIHCRWRRYPRTLQPFPPQAAYEPD